MSDKRIALALFGPPHQGSFNESGLAGAQRAQAAGFDVDVHWIIAHDPEERTAALHRLCAQGKGLDLLVAHGGQGDGPVASVSALFPQTCFAITQGGFVSANTACYEVLQEQSAFLAGVLAGLLSETGTVAHLSGEKVKPGLKGRAAFAQGVGEAGTGCRFLTTFIGNQHDPDQAYRVSCQLQRAGADLIFAMIDGGRSGVSRACRELPLRQIGNVLDWVAREPQVFVASAFADSGRCAQDAIEDFSAGRLRPGATRTHGLESPDYVRLITHPRVSAAHSAVLAQWQARLSSGAFRLQTDYNGPEFA